MTSQINPNNVDGTYPVAGQPNNTQGFRDNFTNIKTNFSYAETEITDLQNNPSASNVDLTNYYTKSEIISKITNYIYEFENSFLIK